MRKELVVHPTAPSPVPASVGGLPTGLPPPVRGLDHGVGVGGSGVAAPPQSSPPPAAAIAALTRLNRAVQRASIYPTGHPSVRLTVQPFVDVLRDLFREVSEVTLLVSRASIVVACGDRHSPMETVPWLAARLSDRGIAVIRFEHPPDETGAVDLIAWLAAPGGVETGHTPPSIHGVSVLAADYSAIQFVEGVGKDGTGLAEIGMVWRRMVAGLVAGGIVPGDGDMSSLENPETLARHIERYLATHEGTGVGALVAQMAAASEMATELSIPTADAVHGKLAVMTACLPQSVRTQLLTVTPTTSGPRLQLMSALVDHLPPAALLDVLSSMQVAPAVGSLPFVSFLAKLGTIAIAHGGELHDAYTRGVGQAGIAPHTVNLGGDELRAALETILLKPLDDSATSESYRQQLDSLDGLDPRAPAYDASHFTAADSAAGVAAHAAAIAVQIVLAQPESTENPPLLRRAVAVMPAALAARDFALLAHVVDASNVAGPPEPTEAWTGATSEVKAFAARAETIACVLGALDGASPTTVGHLAIVARAGGLATASALLGRIDTTSAADDREPLTALLATFSTSELTELLSAARGQRRVSPSVLTAVLCHPRVTAPHELAALFLDDVDADLRLHAYKVALNAAPSASRVERLVQAALDDADPRIVELAVSELRSKAPSFSARPLGRLLSHPTTPAAERAQRLAVQTLLEAGAPLGRDHLVAALANRGNAWRGPSRRVSLSISRALRRIGGPPAEQAARRWRRSPAGLVSFLCRDRLD